MDKGKLFNNLFIFEMANNHMGSVAHGKKIINEFHKVAKKYDFQFAFKFQYRQLDSFIHPDYKDRLDIKYIKRFSETRISHDDFLEMKKEAEKCGFLTMCTPFDNESVKVIVDHGYDIIKIASCSLTDWPLLEEISKTDKPIVLSTAGGKLEDIDKVVSFFEHRGKDFAIMHCVGEYPTQVQNLELNQIDLLKNRYPEFPVGYSTHEDPNNFDGIKIAIAKGAQIFEKHTGVKTEEYDINGYSIQPEQADKWLAAAVETLKMCGVKTERHQCSEGEINALLNLRRGVYAKKLIKKGDKISSDNVFFAMPNQEGQVTANDLSKYSEFKALEDIKPNQPVYNSKVEYKNLREKVLSIINQVKEILEKAGVPLKDRLELELSHHYGIEKFMEAGATIINCINREYCKKLIILLPGQHHPMHHHVKKEETFNVIYGDVNLELKGETRLLERGDMFTVEREMEHAFSSEGGAIFEEISTTHFKNDSFYDDKKIMGNQDRKTQMTFWADWLEKQLS